jgi:hypothetical protein
MLLTFYFTINSYIKIRIKHEEITKATKTRGRSFIQILEIETQENPDLCITLAVWPHPPAAGTRTFLTTFQHMDLFLLWPGLEISGAHCMAALFPPVQSPGYRPGCGMVVLWVSLASSPLLQLPPPVTWRTDLQAVRAGWRTAAGDPDIAGTG